MKKGQVFLIIALVVFVTIAAVRLESGVLESIGRSDSQLRVLPDETFTNTKSELVYAADLGIGQAQETSTLDEYVSNFTTFLKSEEDVEILYVIANFNDATSQLNITVGNYLGQTINDIIIEENLTDSSNIVSSLTDENSTTEIISNNPGSETIIEVNVSFEASDSSVYNETFITKAGEFNYTTIYYNYQLNTGNTFLSDRFQANKKSD